MYDGFPAVTSKKLAFGGVKGELVGFSHGCTSVAEFWALGCQVWNENANVTPAWLANPYRGDRADYLGPIYGAQWTAWKAYREQDLSDKRMVDHLIENGFKLVATNHDYARRISGHVRNAVRSPDARVRVPGASGVFLKTINQLEKALRTLSLKPEHFWHEGYESRSTIKAKMAA